MRTLRIGMVGAGWMGKVHSMSYRTARSAFGPEPAAPVLASIADVSLELAQKGAGEFGYERAVSDWREIIDDKSIEIVDICTPNDMHFDVAMAAIAAGKHVYCEKPLANSVDHARQMARAAERAGVTTLVGFNYIQNPVHALARQALRRGDIGEVIYARLFFNSDFMADRNLQHTWRNDAARAGSGVIGDIGAHCLSYFFYLVEQEIEEVFCNLETVIADHPAPLVSGGFRLDSVGDASRRVKNTTDDIATVIFKFAGGSGHIEASRVSAGIKFEIGYDIVGTQGSLRYSYDRINDICISRHSGPPESWGMTRIEMGPSDPRYAAFLPVSGLGLGYNDYKAIEAREMIAAVGEGRKAMPDFGFGLRVQEVVEACERSHAKRAWVRVGS
ncbi:MAG: Gfo/Idh/MocA family oxidoreductase [Methylobacteriaceae bacterium]|nr:Gfo/Idh/MocA family oxidoreductase [Methylobacteriaceae bacterium]